MRSEPLKRLLKPDASDETWRYFGSKCPYYGVVSWEKFRPENFTEASKAEFFQTGENYIGWVFETVRSTLDPAFSPTRALDFGSGVGRLALPLAKRCGSVTGVDVSPDMIREAEANCRAFGVENARFVQDLKELASSTERFDFINSFIVFQHIPPKRGYEIARNLVSLLAEGGVGALHFTYHHPGGKRDRWMEAVYRKVPLAYAIHNVLNGKSFSEPRMEMAEYSLNRLFSILQRAGCSVGHTVLTNHGVFGVVIFFRKIAPPEL